MKAHILNVGITKNYFNAVSNQFLPMHSAACEPMDNILSNSTGPVNALVAFVPGSEKDLIGMVTADWGNGMDINEGSSPPRSRKRIPTISLTAPSTPR